MSGLTASLAVATAAVLTTQPAAAAPPGGSAEPCVIVMPVDPDQSDRLPELIEQLIATLTELVGGDTVADATGSGRSGCPEGTSGAAGADQPAPGGRDPAGADPVPAPGGTDTGGGDTGGGTGGGPSRTEPGTGDSGTGAGHTDTSPGADPAGSDSTGSGSAGSGSDGSGSPDSASDDSGSDGSSSGGSESGSDDSQSDDSQSGESDSGESSSDESGSDDSESSSSGSGGSSSGDSESSSGGSEPGDSDSGDSQEEEEEASGASSGSGHSGSGGSGSDDGGSESGSSDSSDNSSDNSSNSSSDDSSDGSSDDAASAETGAAGAAATEPAAGAGGEQPPDEASTTTPGTGGEAGVPGDLLDLEKWYLTLPVGPAGDPESIDQPELLTYSGEHFELTPEGDGVVFRAHAGGVTTENSDYARSELREMAGGDEKAAWSNSSGTHTLETRQAITKTPTAKPEVVAAQIHDGGDDVMQIRLEGKTLVAQYADGDEQIVIDPAYELGTPYDLRIVAAGGGITVYYNGEQVAQIPRSGSSWYWKIGAYTQSNPEKGDPPDAVGEVVVYSLAVEHGGT